MVAAAVLYPDYTFFLLILGPVKIKYIAAVSVFLSFISTMGSNAGGELAHIGGALMGWLYVVQLRKGNDIGHWVIRVVEFFKDLFKPKSKIKVSYRREQPRSKSRRPTSKTGNARRAKGGSGLSEQEQIDAILDKISASGYESLTKEEKQKLFNASKK